MIVRVYFCVALALVVVLLFVFSNKKGILSPRLAPGSSQSAKGLAPCFVGTLASEPFVYVSLLSCDQHAMCTKGII